MKLWPIVLALTALLGAACTALPAPAPGAAPPVPQALKVALLPITDVIPFYVAQQEGLFTAAELTAEAVPVSSGAERDTVLQAGAADCALTDIHGVVLTNAGEAQPLRIIATARQATAEQPLFFMLSAPGSEIRAPEQLTGANIGISENTVIDYWNDRILAQAGVDPAGVTRTNVPQIPVRLELLLNNRLDAVILPDPLASLAQLQGAHLVTDDTVLPEIAVSVLACREDVLAAQPDAVRAFLQGWDQAVAAINADPAAFANVLLENTRVPEPLQDRYTLPSFAVRLTPSPAQVADVVAWAVDKGLVAEPLTYEQVVDASLRQ